MPDVEVIAQGTVCRDAFRYSAHPHVTLAPGGDILVVFNQSVRRPVILHPPHDPEYRNLITRSGDGGRTWSAPEVVPDYGHSGTECAGLTTLRSGRVLLNQWRNRWYPLGLARAEPSEPVDMPSDFVAELVASAELDSGERIAAAPEAVAPWARGHGESLIHISDDSGRSFGVTTRIDTGPFHGGYGLRGCVEMPDGTLLLPLNDIPEFRTVFLVRSTDRGQTWRDPALVARIDEGLLTEPALLYTRSGILLCMMREDVTRIMHLTLSDDAGVTWSQPRPTRIDGYPPHLLVLPDGRVLCTYGQRQPEYSIRAVVSDDDGESWSTADPLLIRRHLPNRDLGYPSTMGLPNGSLITVYYCQDEAGVTGVEYTIWRPPLTA